MIKNAENLSNLCFIDHFKHSTTLKENLFKSLAIIFKSVGKKKLRGFVELFLDPTFRNAKSLDHQATNMSLSAQDFILELERTYGENIFRAIVESHDDHLLPELKRIREEGQRGQAIDFQYPVHNSH